MKENLRLVELCSGIGAQAKGIKNTGLFNLETVATADLDKEVVVSYAAIHCGLTNELILNYENYPSKEEMINGLSKKRLGYDFKKDKPYDWNKLAKRKDKTKGVEKYWLADRLSHNLGDVTKVEELPECDFLTMSFPCTDISISGQQQGLKWTCQDCKYEYDPSILSVETRYTCPLCGSNNIKSTRSGLLYEAERLLVKIKKKNKLPKYLFMENVDALVSKKYIDSFNDWIDRLSNLGYVSYYQTMNAKNFGIPQSRNRIFVVSILKEFDTGKFEFPKPFNNGLKLKDFLDDDSLIEEKYFLSDEIQERLHVSNCENTLMHVADLCSEKYMKMLKHLRRVYSEDGIAPTIHTVPGGNTEPKVGRNNLKIVRKITPKEANRLMGFNDEDYENCKAVGMSDTQGYRQAGNSIVVNCVELIIEHLYKAQYDEDYRCYDENFQSPQES